MPIIIPANSAVAGGYEVTNSARFNPASNDRLTRTPASSGNRLKWTWSGWAKRGTDNQDLYLFSAYQNSSYNTYLKFASGGEIRFADVYNGSDQAKINTLAKFRDLSAWYHIVVVYDRNNATSTDRLIIYVNGVRITQFDGSTMPTQSTTFNVDNVQIQIGAFNGDGDMNGYLSEICFVDNQALAPTSFGEFDEDSGIWKPIESVADLTFGTNGFYMDFKDSSELGNDAAGSNNYAEVNMTALNQTTDTCTNNFATLNPLASLPNTGTSTFTEGNLVSSGATGSYVNGGSTLMMPSGKWYCEMKYISTSNSNRLIVGITQDVSEISRINQDSGALNTFYVSGDGNKNIQGTDSSYGSSFDVGDIVGIALDLDNNKLYFSKNGTFQNSGNPTSGSTGTGAITGFAVPSETRLGGYFFFSGSNSNAQYNNASFNFGNPTFAISSGNTDGNGRGNFEYAVPSGYLALCTKNLSGELS